VFDTQTGDDPLIRKPFKINDLAGAVQKVLGGAPAVAAAAPTCGSGPTAADPPGRRGRSLL
jgi:hypothetical protein